MEEAADLVGIRGRNRGENISSSHLSQKLLRRAREAIERGSPLLASASMHRPFFRPPNSFPFFFGPFIQETASFLPLLPISIAQLLTAAPPSNEALVLATSPLPPSVIDDSPSKILIFPLPLCEIVVSLRENTFVLLKIKGKRGR
ncbi:hypothetical protein ACP275_12G049000 [Erythranthe tilingii]